MCLSDAERIIINSLQRRGFNIKKIGEKLYTASKELKPIGIKRRYIFCVVMFTNKKIDINVVKEVHKLFEKKKPVSWRTFFFYNIIFVTTKGYTDEAMNFIRKKLMGVFNIRPIMIWDILSTSFTKITHIIDLSSRTIIYPYPYEELQTLIHREIRELINEVTASIGRL